MKRRSDTSRRRLNSIQAYPMAKSYLATALAQNVVPGLNTEENMKTAQQAISIFQEVLAKDPSDINSLKQVAVFTSA